MPFHVMYFRNNNAETGAPLEVQYDPISPDDVGMQIEFTTGLSAFMNYTTKLYYTSSETEEFCSYIESTLPQRYGCEIPIGFKKDSR